MARTKVSRKEGERARATRRGTRRSTRTAPRPTRAPLTASAIEARFFHAMIENLPLGAVYVDTSHIVMNAAAEALTGYGRGELRTLDRLCTALCGPRAAAVRQIFESTAEDATHLTALVPISRKDGHARVLELAGRRFGKHGVWLLIDRTELDQLTQALQSSETHLRSILDSVADGVVTLDRDDRIASANRAAEAMTGYAAAELIGQPVALVIPSYAVAIRTSTHHTPHGRTSLAPPRGATSFEATARRRDGQTFPVEVTLTTAGGTRTGIIRDIRGRRELERRLAEGVTARSAELARELHDGLGGQLTAIALLLEGLRTQLMRAGSAEASRVADLMRHVDTAHVQLRSTTRGLMPVEDVPEGLMEALRVLAGQYDDAVSEVRFVCPSPIHFRDRVVGTHLFRIAQEAVANAIQHGKARHVTVTLARENGRIRLSVQDDGGGFGPVPIPHQGIGLLNMRQRASLLGAEFRVGKPEVPDGRGTVVSCVVPATVENA